jgi:hypothetical protein
MPYPPHYSLWTESSLLRILLNMSCRAVVFSLGYAYPRGHILGGYANKTNSVALSPQATATCRRILVPTFADRGVSRCQRGGSHTVVNRSFLDRSRYFSFK